jgi:hypothetical protein
MPRPRGRRRGLGLLAVEFGGAEVTRGGVGFEVEEKSCRVGEYETGEYHYSLELELAGLRLDGLGSCRRGSR